MSTRGRVSTPIARKLTIAGLLAVTAVVVRGSMGVVAAFDGLANRHQAFIRLPELMEGVIELALL